MESKPVAYIPHKLDFASVPTIRFPPSIPSEASVNDRLRGENINTINKPFLPQLGNFLSQQSK